MGMILRCLPQEVLAADISDFEASGAAATEIGLPMNMILSQLPSGKVEMTLQELVPHFPPGYLQPTESITSYLPQLINLPLMDVVMRIPPDLLALRPDQKDVDASVINMADPFTEEILREQAEAARNQAQAQTKTNIIEESQAPTEEFVPRDQATATRSFVPPPRPPSTALPAVPRPPTPVTGGLPPMTPVNKITIPPPTPRTGAIPPIPSVARASAPVPPVAPNTTSRTISPSGRLPAPTRATTPIPARIHAAVTMPVSLASIDSRPPGATGQPAVPMPASPRPTTSLPMPPPAIRVPQPPQPLLRPSVTSATPTVPVLPKSASDTPEPVPEPESPEEKPTFPQPGEPDAAADELQRLAALAMQQMGEEGEGQPATPEVVPSPVAETQPVEVPIGETVTAPTQAIPPPPPPVPVESFRTTLQPVTAQTRGFGSKSITAPMPPLVESPVPTPLAPVAPPPVEQPEAQEAPASHALNLNSCTADELLAIPGCTTLLADSIVRYRNKIGSFKRIEDLLDVPGMNSAAYSNLTGEAPPQSGVSHSLSELLGFPAEQKVTLKDVTERITCWPDVTGCVLSQKSGLSLVGTVPSGFDKDAIVAFAPRMFEAINKSFGEIAGKETDELIIPTTGTSFHIFRSHDLYLIILSRLPQMPDRHVKIARLVLAGLSLRPT